MDVIEKSGIRVLIPCWITVPPVLFVLNPLRSHLIVQLLSLKCGHSLLVMSAPMIFQIISLLGPVVSVPVPVVGSIIVVSVPRAIGMAFVLVFFVSTISGIALTIRVVRIDPIGWILLLRSNSAFFPLQPLLVLRAVFAVSLVQPGAFVLSCPKRLFLGLRVGLGFSW